MTCIQYCSIIPLIGITDLLYFSFFNSGSQNSFNLRVSIWPVRGRRSYVCSKPHLTHNSLINWWPSFPHSSSLTCHKPRPDPHSHSSTLPRDSAHQVGPHTHSSTKYHLAPPPCWIASSWWTAAHPISYRRSSFTFRETEKAEMNWGQQLVYTLQPHP